MIIDYNPNTKWIWNCNIPLNRPWNLYEVGKNNKHILLVIGDKDKVTRLIKEPKWKESSCKVTYSNGDTEIHGYTELCRLFRESDYNDGECFGKEFVAEHHCIKAIDWEVKENNNGSFRSKTINSQ